MCYCGNIEGGLIVQYDQPKTPADPQTYTEGSNLRVLLDAAKDVLGDLELFCTKQGPGPDRRLKALKDAIQLFDPESATQSAGESAE